MNVSSIKLTDFHMLFQAGRYPASFGNFSDICFIFQGRPTIQAELRERGKNRLIACAVVELDFGR